MSCPISIPSISPILKTEPLPILISLSAPLIVTALFPTPAASCPLFISNPPIWPAVAVIVPDISTLPALSKWKFDELISICSLEPLMNCVVVFPTKNESACTSNTDGLVLNFREPLAPTNSKPTPL